eukprot:2318848-Prymnesium_polylepis.1
MVRREAVSSATRALRCALVRDKQTEHYFNHNRGANGSVRTCHFQDGKSCRKLGPEPPLEQPPPGQISAHDHGAPTKRASQCCAERACALHYEAAFAVH